jgi:HlyB family type I secretion system ABC transporter
MNSSSSLRVQEEHQYTSVQQSSTPTAAILNLLRLVAGDTCLASDFSQVWIFREFQLGDNLARYCLERETVDSNHVIYLVCQGRVRLLGFDATLGRLVSTQLLLENHTFGADGVFCNQSLPYQAIAASKGWIAEISSSDLNPWLQQIPNLQDYFRRLACERQALIFFKTYTELRVQTSLTLRQLLPYLEQTQIKAGSSLMEATRKNGGRFWLANGKIQTDTAETQLLQLGDSWGYADVIPNAIAQTDLFFYHLPTAYWDAVKVFAPQLFSQKLKPTNFENTHLQAPQIELPFPNPQLESPVSVPPDFDVDLPQPKNQPWSIARFWRLYPFIQQQSSSDCGATCLAMVSQYWGKRFSLNTLRELAQTDRMGATLKGLETAAASLGYDVLSVRASLSKLELQTNPWIAHWQGLHYVVVWQIKGDRVLISDPAIGKRQLTLLEFEASWTGYALLLEPTPSFHTRKSEKISLGRYFESFWHYREILGQIILASILLQFFGLATPLLTQVVLDRVLPFQNFLTLNIFAASFLIFGIWRIALAAVRQHLLDYLGNCIDLTLIGSFIRHTLQLPLQFFASRQIGDIITRVQENRTIQQFITRQALNTTLDALMAIAYLGLMAYYNLQLTLLVLGLILPILILTVGASPFLKQVSREIFKKSAEQNSSIVEMISAIVTIKTAATEKSLLWRWEQRFTNSVKSRFRGQKLANNLQLASSLINHLGTTAVLWYGANLAIGKQLSIGQFVAFNMLLGNVINPVLALAGLWDEFQEALISMERLNDVFTAHPEENLEKPLQVLPPIHGEIHFQNVTFRYNLEEERNILENISFQVKPRQTIAIVGTSGSGKSTLVNLLAGLYQPHSGRILIDGHDIAAVSPQSLRSQLGVVPQECFLFSGTILENITLYSSDFTLEQVIAAAKLAEAHDFIQTLPLGYHTRVGEGGSMFSGGQRQRIAIARALIKNPQILILDEATSSLDAESARRFQQNLPRFHPLKTILIVTHRLSTIQKSDRILVLDRGILIEQGTHPELMALGGLYYHLAQQQLHL